MKLLILIITVCGQPDYILIKEYGRPPIGDKVEVIKKDPYKLRDLNNYLSREDKEVITFGYDNGLCT